MVLGIESRVPYMRSLIEFVYVLCVLVCIPLWEYTLNVHIETPEEVTGYFSYHSLPHYARSLLFWLGGLVGERLGPAGTQHFQLLRECWGLELGSSQQAPFLTY